MARTKKEVAESAKAVAETVAEKAGAVAETVAEKAEAVVAAAKSAAKPRRAAKKTAETKDAQAAKAPRAAKKAADKLNTKVVIELAERSASADSLIERAKEDWTAKGNVLDDMKELALYVNAGEGMVYYVVNDDYLSGSFAI